MKHFLFSCVIVRTVALNISEIHMFMELITPMKCTDLEFIMYEYCFFCRQPVNGYVHQYAKEMQPQLNVDSFLYLHV